METKVFSAEKSSNTEDVNWIETFKTERDPMPIQEFVDDRVYTYYHRSKHSIWAKDQYGTRISFPFLGNESWIFEICKRKYGTLIKIEFGEKLK